jgi:phenylpropionate dioxygenase-like ring-hydroxylating dioxygenase large terminal subunit
MMTPQDTPAIRDTKWHHDYPRNTWWVAARPEEITRTPLRRWILERPVLLYRDTAGRVVALEDRCPHRSASLSCGQVIEDTIQCPYHGMRFDPTGACVRVPSQNTVPSGLKVQAYPVREAQPFVWIWMGDPNRIGEYNAPPDTTWAEDAAASFVGDQMEVRGNYMWLQENVLDLTHLEYVHASTLSLSDHVQIPSVETTDTKVICRLNIPGRKLPSYLTRWTELPGDKPCDWSSQTVFESPALHHATENILDAAPEPGRPSHYVYHSMHATTPIDRHRFRYFWVVGCNIPVTDEVKKRWATAVPMVFGQDKVILEQIEDTLSQDPRADFPEVSVRADQAGVQARRRLALLLAREGAVAPGAMP